MRRFNRQDAVSSLLGPRALLTGELEFQGTLRLDGTFHGSIKTRGTLVVGKEATVDGEVCAGEVQIFGLVRARVISAERVEIYEGGVLEGDVRTPSLVIEDGAQFEGVRQRTPKTNQDDLRTARENHPRTEEQSELEEASPSFEQSPKRSTSSFEQLRSFVHSALKRPESMPSGSDSL
jgi:cytoskeletal protein CcmA (bactofilin family)